jgi:Reverse transcriptase (RNA-dependent DNA polymerase)
VITPFGLFEFSLKNAGMMFQRVINQIFANIPYVFIYLDDVLVASKSMTDHIQHLHRVSLLHANGLHLNAEKCVWAAQQVEFLHHNILATGIAPLRDRVQAIPHPSTVRDLQGFLGLFNYYRRFMASADALI